MSLENKNFPAVEPQIPNTGSPSQWRQPRSPKWWNTGLMSTRGLHLQFFRDERKVFSASTGLMSMVVGDGASALFWEKCWLDGRDILVWA